MGNCIRPASSMEWGGDDWGSLRSEPENKIKPSSSNKVFDETHHVLSLGKNVKKEKLLQELKSSCDSNGKVKIKISKKEVAELLGVIEKQNQNKNKESGSGASAEQVLIRLINSRDNKDHENYHHRPWSPELETVPELD